MSLRVKAHPQNFFPRKQNELIPKIDQIKTDEYNRRVANMRPGNGITQSEITLANNLRLLGVPVVHQWAMRDMDAHKLKDAYDEYGELIPLRYWNSFLWLYDLYLPKQDLVIEVDGPSHQTAYQQKQDARKEELLRLHNIPFLRLTNAEAVRMGTAIDIAHGHPVYRAT